MRNGASKPHSPSHPGGNTRHHRAEAEEAVQVQQRETPGVTAGTVMAAELISWRHKDGHSLEMTWDF